MWKQAQYLEMKENLVLSLQKYPFTRRSDKKKKKRIKELGPDHPYFQFVCAPPNFFCTIRHILKASYERVAQHFSAIENALVLICS